MALKYFLIFLFAFSINTVSAQQKTFKFNEHDNIGFIGDSISQGISLKAGSTWKDGMGKGGMELAGLYHQYIQLFLSTRFPGKDLWTVNLGHAGGKASDGLKRLDYDIFTSDLDKAFIHFGMNDFRYFLYLDPKSTPSDEKKQSMKTDYVKNMTELVDSINQKGIQIGFLSPTIYDETSKLNTKKAKGAAAELANYVELSKSLAQKYKLPFIDLFEPMMTLTLEQQKKNKHWSITKDRVHPAEANGGSQFIAYEILKQLAMDGVVYELDLSWTGKVHNAHKVGVTEIKSSKGKLSFTTTESSLPFPIIESDIGFQEHTLFQQELNLQKLTVKDLLKGQYELKIDDQSVGEYTHKELASGINLSSNTKTPQHKLSSSFRELVLFRKAVLEQRVRVMKNNIRFVLKAEKSIDWQDPKSILAVLKTFKAKKKAKGQKIQGWQSYLVSTAEYSLERYDSIYAELKSIRQKLAALPKTRSYKYELLKLN
ncbi:MAG: GDSL-type esterase/lipase family protein [Lentisphaeraceae bacterium]|nr:GDSL-type esterase/lipase family protein [Lentisphaeraceae bacterium]